MLNEGVSFGIWRGIPLWVLVLTYCALVFVFWREKYFWGKVGLGMILVGGGMNISDRIRIGAVLDNLNFLGLLYNNCADYLIFGGLVIYGYTYLVRRR